MKNVESKITLEFVREEELEDLKKKRRSCCKRVWSTGWTNTR